MAVNPDAAFSRADLMREIAALKRRIQALETARRLESAAVGRGGLRVFGGGGVTLEEGGSLLVDDGGDITVQGGRLVALDPDGENVFVVDTDPAAIFMRASLIETLAAQIFAARVDAGYVQTQETTTSLAYGNLATVGPTASVPVTSGTAIVWMSALIEADCSAGGPTVSADMGFEITGATSRLPGQLGQFLMQANFDIAEETSNTARMGITAVATGLNEGDHTFTAKYRRVQGTAPVPFGERTIVVMGL